MNLYMVLDNNYDWCCFAFDISRNKAKLRVAKEFGNDYTEMRCKTLRKGINVTVPMLVTHPDDDGYDIVQDCGYEYGADDFEARDILQDILEEEKLERHIEEMLMDAIEEGADNA